ncbi:MAG: response regulator transcription factor [Bacteroidetes bacterium]|nr:response regulator transcription factor [Bacteroidota bacterium]
MHLLRAIIIDDEEFCQKNLAQLLKVHCPEIEIVGFADSASTATEEIALKAPDLIFLDINIPGKSGLEILADIKERKFNVIVVTGEKEHGIRALKQNVLDYVLKPLEVDEVKEAVAKAVFKSLEDKSSSGKDKILLPVQSGFKVLRIDEILFLEGQDNYTEVNYSSGQILVSKTLNDYVNLLNYSNFYRIHKKYLINLRHIREFSYKDGGYVTMTNDKQLSISRNRLKDFVNRMRYYAISSSNH